MSEVKRYKAVINDKPYKPYAYCEESNDGIYVRHDDYSALKAECESNAKSAQYSAETNRKVVSKNADLYEQLLKMKAERDALAANVSDGLFHLAGAMLNRTLDSGSKQAVAYAECADMVATFATNLRKENGNG